MFHYEHDELFSLESGESLENLKITYSTYGKLNKAKDNVIWVFHALTANSNVHEWWSDMMGNDKVMSAEEYFIVCANVVGSHYGSTGPLTPRKNRRPLFNDFPLITIRDMVNAHIVLKDHLKIERIYLGIGGSLGGQQLLEWSILEPELFENCCLIATNAVHSPYGIAFNESQRLSILSDNTFGNKSAEAGKAGLVAARSIALLSYRSYEAYLRTQKNKESSKVDDFLASSYQIYQGNKLANRFNAYSYYLLTKAMDSHNVARGAYSYQEALGQIQARTLIIGITSDQLFPFVEQQFLHEHIAKSELYEIESDYGHDGFLIETEQINHLLEDFLKNNFLKHKKTSFKLNLN